MWQGARAMVFRGHFVACGKAAPSPQPALRHIRVSLFLKHPCFKRPCDMIPHSKPVWVLALAVVPPEPLDLLVQSLRGHLIRCQGRADAQFDFGPQLVGAAFQQGITAAEQ